MVGAPWLVELFAGGLHARPDAFERTVSLTRWVFPYIFFMGTAALGHGGAQHVGPLRRGGVCARAPQRRVHRGCARPAFGVAARGADPFWRLAVGALAGGALQVVAQWPSLRKIGFAGAAALRFSRSVRTALARMVPMTAGIGIYASIWCVSRRFLSTSPRGPQSYFSWAMRLCDFPQGIFVLALQAATLPSLAKLVAERRLDEVAKTYAYGCASRSS